jgi:hypothetical protein
MKTLLALIALALSLGIPHAKAQSKDTNKLAREAMEEFIAEESAFLSLPRPGKKKFYTYCGSVQFVLILGYETGACISMSLDSTGRIDYIPTRLRNWKVSWGAGIHRNHGSLHRIRGINSLSDINGYYLIASSGVGFIAHVRENWFTIKLSLKDLVGNSPEMDGGIPVLSAGLDIISLGLMQYKSVPGAKVQSINLKL